MIKIIAPIIVTSIIGSSSYFYISKDKKDKEEVIKENIKEPPKTQDNLISQESLLPEGFIGEVANEPEKEIIIESPFVEKEQEPRIIYIKEPEIKKIRATNTFSGNNYISYDEESPTDIFQKEQSEDNDSTVASRKYDLSQIITTDKFIPAVLITAINSEIATEGIVAQIEQDVYGYEPKDILLPKGSKIEGRIQGLEKNSTRANISWYKIITPSGQIISLKSTSFDSHGASGLSGDLDTKLIDRYGAGILFSLINAATNLSIDAENQAQLMIAESMQRSLLPLTNQVIKENFDLKPTIKIKQGQRLIVKPFQNIIFEKNKKNNNKINIEISSDKIFK